MLSTVAIASTFVAAAAALPIASFVEVPEFIYNHTATSTSTFGNFTAMEYAISNGSCWDSKKTDLVVSIKVNQTDANVCGTQVNITNLDNGKSVLAQVVDECLDCAYDYLLLSPAAYSAVSSAKNFTASYTFSNYTEPASTSGSSGSSSSGKSGNASPDSKPAASSSSSQGKWTPAASPSSSSSTKKGSDSEWTSSSSKSEWTSSSKSESKPAPQTSSSKDDVKTTSTSQKYTQEDNTPSFTPKATTQNAQAKYTPETSTTESPKWTPKPTTSTKEYTPEAQPTTSKKQSSSYSGSGGSYHGQATWYTQDGNPGACGNYHSDGDYICAVNSAQFSGSCGKSIRVCNDNTGSCITVQAQDECPGCGYGSLDLSTGAFSALSSLGNGVFPISWSYQ